MDKTISQIISEIKHNKKGWDILFAYLQPLIQSYTKKLFFLDKDDAQQELYLSLIEAVQKMRHYNNDGECLIYLKNAVYYTYIHLCKRNLKNISTLSLDCTYYLSDSIQQCPFYDDSIYYLDLMAQFNKLSPQKRQIIFRVLNGYRDDEIAQQLNISRQYVNRIKHEAFEYKNAK